jgi:CxxC motif-containing protein
VNEREKEMRSMIMLGMTSLLLMSCEVEVKKRRKEYKGSLGLVKGKTYNSEIKFNSKKKVTLVVKDIKFEGKEIDMKAAFKIPKGTKLPKRNGKFHIAAADSGQHVDVQGEVATEFTS